MNRNILYDISSRQSVPTLFLLGNVLQFLWKKEYFYKFLLIHIIVNNFRIGIVKLHGAFDMCW